MPFKQIQTTLVETEQLRQLFRALNSAQFCAEEAFKVTPDYGIKAVGSRVPTLQQIRRAKEITEHMLGFDKEQIETTD